jgi:hypothetical protein
MSKGPVSPAGYGEASGLDVWGQIEQAYESYLSDEHAGEQPALAADHDRRVIAAERARICRRIDELHGQTLAAQLKDELFGGDGS